MTFVRKVYPKLVGKSNLINLRSLHVGWNFNSYKVVVDQKKPQSIQTGLDNLANNLLLTEIIKGNFILFAYL